MLKDSIPLFSISSHRLRIAFLLAIAFCLTVCMRVNLSLGITCMVNTTALVAQKPLLLALNDSHQEERHQSSCQAPNNDQGTTLNDGYSGSLLWSPSMTSMILSAPFYGQLATMTIAGYVVDRYGPKLALNSAVIISMIASAVGPLLAVRSYWAFWVSRAFLGSGQTFVYPSCNSMASKWFPPEERATIGAIYTSGVQVAAGTTSFVVAALCTSSLGWPATFYSFALISFIWLAIWQLFVTDAPTENRWLGEAEAAYIERATNSKKNSEHFKEQAFPWRQIFFSKATQAVYVGQFAFGYCSVVVQTYLPLYLKEQLNLPIHLNGLYTITPFLAQIIAKNLLAWISDYLKRRAYFDPTSLAKTFESFCELGVAASLLGMIYLPTCDRTWVVIPILTLYGFAFSAAIPGSFTSLLTIAPPYTGTISSVAMVYLTISGIAATQVVTVIELLGWPHKWTIVFGTGVALNLISLSAFLLFGEMKVQEWAELRKVNDEEAELKGLVKDIK